MDDKALAATINAAIDELLKSGPRPAPLELWRCTIEQTLDQAAPSALAGSALLQNHYQQFMDLIVNAKGLPVRSVQVSGDVADGQAAPASHVLGGGETFARLEPKIRAIFFDCMKAAHDQAAPFRKKELQGALAAFETWARSIPNGGTKDPAYRAAARTVRQSLKAFPKWDDFYCRHKAQNFSAGIQGLFAEEGGGFNPHGAEHSGPVSGTWQWSQSTCDLGHELYSDRTFLVRGNWASAKGLLKDVAALHTDEIPRPGLDGCGCFYRYGYGLTGLPPELISAAGRDVQARARNFTRTLSDPSPSEPGRPHSKPASLWQKLLRRFD